MEQILENMNKIHDLSCWPLIQEILTEEPDFWSTKLTTENDRIFICDHGTRAILVSYRNECTKLYLWNAGFRNKSIDAKSSSSSSSSSMDKSPTHQQQLRRWFLLNDLCFRCPIKQIRFINGWLFILTANDRLHCRDLDVCENISDNNQSIHNDKNFYEKNRLIYPFEQCIKLTPLLPSLLLLGGDANNHYKQQQQEQCKFATIRQKTTYIMDNVAKFDQSETYTVILMKNMATIHLMTWLIHPNHNRQLFEHHIEHTSFPRLRFHDVAVFARGWIALTNQQTLLIEGSFMPDIQPEKQHIYPRMTVIDLKELQFPMKYGNGYPSSSSSPIYFNRIYASKHQLLLLTDNGIIYCLIFTQNIPYILGTFMNSSIPIIQIYSHYNSSNFIAIGVDEKIHVYCPKPIPIDPSGYHTVEMMNQQQQQMPGPRNCLVVTAFQSIPDAYSIFIQSGDMSTMASSYNVVEMFNNSKSNQNYYRFNDPITSDIMVSLNEQNYFLQSKIVTPLMEMLKKYFHFQNIRRQENNKIVLKKSISSSSSSSAAEATTTTTKTLIMDPDQILDCPMEQSKRLQRFNYKFFDLMETTNNTTTTSAANNDGQMINTQLSTFSPELIRSFLKLFYIGQFELSDSFIYEELQSFVHTILEREPTIATNNFMLRCFHRGIRIFFKNVMIQQQQQQQQQQQITKNLNNSSIIFFGKKLVIRYRYRKSDNYINYYNNNNNNNQNNNLLNTHDMIQ
ncbi:uncharacterized protein LOC124498265 [Dermatophagoides farinae]|uniref:uncharacterized protein LOC124498265 n=1 Tax=Dermatophagoides farinae TaxID=6954 RepID=UPI003F5E86A2